MAGLTEITILDSERNISLCSDHVRQNNQTLTSLSAPRLIFNDQVTFLSLKSLTCISFPKNALFPALTSLTMKGVGSSDELDNVPFGQITELDIRLTPITKQHMDMIWEQVSKMVNLKVLKIDGNFQLPNHFIPGIHQLREVKIVFRRGKVFRKAGDYFISSMCLNNKRLRSVFMNNVKFTQAAKGRIRRLPHLQEVTILKPTYGPEIHGLEDLFFPFPIPTALQAQAHAALQAQAQAAPAPVMNQNVVTGDEPEGESPNSCSIQ